MTEDNQKWVACWGNATSITNRREAVYAKDLTLRYPVRMCFSGSMLRFRFSNLTGTEPVTLNKVFVGHTPVTFGGERSVTLQPGTETESDAVSYAVHRGDTIEVSFYLADYTQMNSGTLVTGPLSKGYYAYGDYAEADELPLNLSRSTNWFYFLNTIDILTAADNHAIVCYGDSITAQAWPDYMAQQAFGTNASIIRRAVSGTRILRQYDCITYQAYGLKGATRFPIEITGRREHLRQTRQGTRTEGVERHPAAHLRMAHLQRRPRTDAPAVQRVAAHVAHFRRLHRLRCRRSQRHQSQGLCRRL